MVQYNGRIAPSTLFIVIHPLDRRGRFSARIEGGRPLVSASRTPFLAAARELLRLGFTPETTLLMRHEGSRTTALQSSLGVAAGLVVEERGHGRINFAGWKPFSPRAVAPPVRRKAGSLSGVAAAGLAR
jgi:hypothetical protein